MFQPGGASHSPRLATFDGPAPRVLDHLGAADARIAAKPGFQTLIKGGGALGAAGVVYGGISTTREAIHQLDQGNVTGASRKSCTSAPAWRAVRSRGAATGAAYGAATGSWTGPGALVTGLVGGFVGAVAGDKIMDAADRARIYNQRDSDGKLWHYDEKHPEHGWSRTEQVRALDAQGHPKVALGKGYSVEVRVHFEPLIEGLRQPSAPEGTGQRSAPAKQRLHSSRVLRLIPSHIHQ